jgi:PAS domain S-box-containing protein
MADDERRQAAETELRVAADSMLDGFGILSQVRDDAGEISDFRYRYVNDAYCAFVGFDRGLLLGHRVGELFPQFLDGERFELYRRVALTGEPFRTDEVQLPSAWDSTALASRVFDTVIASIGEDLELSVRDITERKRAQEQLVQTAGLLERTQEISKTGGWEYDVATARLTWTDEVYRIYGIERTSDPPEVATTIAAYDQESAPIISAAFERLVAEGEPYDLELGLVRADGRRIWARTIGRPVFEGGRVVRVNGAIADITERKEAEQELQLRAELLDLAHDAVIVRDPVESRVTFWNREAETIYDYDRAEAVGRVTHELLGTVFPESKEAVDVALGQHGRWEGELHHTRKDGTVIVVSSRQALARDEHGQPVAIIALNSDVSEQKRSEADLAYMSGLLERTQVIGKTGGWEYDLATRKLTRTGEVYRIFGDERTDLPIELDDAIAGYSPERAPIIGSAFQRLVTEGEPYDLEVDMVRADGEQIWVRVIGQPVLEDGRIVRVGGIVADVTDRRQAEEEIRTLNAELEQRLAARTADLERANRELETFAYSVSHDLRAARGSACQPRAFRRSSRAATWHARRRRSPASLRCPFESGRSRPRGVRRPRDKPGSPPAARTDATSSGSARTRTGTGATGHRTPRRDSCCRSTPPRCAPHARTRSRRGTPPGAAAPPLPRRRSPPRRPRRKSLRRPYQTTLVPLVPTASAARPAAK